MNITFAILDAHTTLRLRLILTLLDITLPNQSNELPMIIVETKTRKHNTYSHSITMASDALINSAETRALVMCVNGTISVATLVAHICLHGARTLGAFHGLRHLPSNSWDIQAAAVLHCLNNLLIVCFERKFKSLFLYEGLPCVEVIKHFQDCEAMTAHHHGRPFAKHGPSTLVFVGKQLLDFFGHSVSLLVDIGEEQALYAVPKAPKNAKVFPSFGALPNTEQLNVDL